MPNIYFIDMESFYDKKTFSLSKIGTTSYIRDPRFEVVGVAVAINEGEPEWFSGTMEETADWLSHFDWANGLFAAHNCAFDAAIAYHHFGIIPLGYIDTMSMANALHGINQSVSLAALSKHYGLVDKGTEVNDASGLRRVEFSAAQLAAYGEYCKHDVVLCRQLFGLMSEAFTMSELQAISMTIRMYAQPVLGLDVPLLEQHLIDVRESQAEILSRLTKALGASTNEEVKTVLMSNPKFAELLKYLDVDPPMKVSPTTGKDAFAFAKTDAEFTALLEHENLTVQAAVAARLGNKTTIEESRTATFIEVGKSGLMPFPLKYSGASVTHRFSGFEFNPQNLGRKSVLRQAIIAPPGHKIVSADLSNIELRVGLYMAREEEAVQAIREGRDLYLDLATNIYHQSYEELQALGKKSTERTVGKVVSLSSIYGTGAAKLRETLRIQGGVKVSLEDAQRMTDVYRSKYINVVGAWDQGKQVLDAMFYHRAMPKFLREGILEVTQHGIIKPSRLVMTYPDLTWARGKDNKMQYTYQQKRSSRDKVYGSKVFQRSIQSLSRDVIVGHMLEIDTQFWVAGTVHDEIICVVADERVEEAKAFMLEVMRTPPSWAPDLPLDAEVEASDNYGGAH